MISFWQGWCHCEPNNLNLRQNTFAALALFGTAIHLEIDGLDTLPGSAAIFVWSILKEILWYG